MSEVSDQAETLRRLMRVRQAWESDSSAKLVVLVSAGSLDMPHAHSPWIANLSCLLARSGVPMVLIDADGSDSRAALGLPDQAGSPSGPQALQPVEPGLWWMKGGDALSGLDLAPDEVKGRIRTLVADGPQDLQAIMVQGGAELAPMCAAASRVMVLMGPEPSSLSETYALVKGIAIEHEVTRFSIIVNRVTDGAHGQEIFRKLREVACRFIDGAEFDYLGHFPKDEKISEAVRNRKILLDLDSRASAVACLGLVAKRFKTSVLGMSGAEAEKIVIRRSLALSRFREEPAHRAPGNMARFWRALLGEVKA